MIKTLRSAALTALALTLAMACQSGDDPTPPNGPADGQTTAWDPSGNAGECNVDALLSPYSYGAKVKTLLTGLPLEDAELQQLVDDPESLKGLIDEWLALPESAAMFERFFMTAFQQTNLDAESFFYLLGRAASTTGNFTNPNTPRVHDMLNANFSESFARTALELVRQGRPFNEVITTDTFMMTTAQMVYLAYIDDDVVDDEEKHTVRTTGGDFPTIRLVRDQASAPPVEQALDPSSPNFATFWHSELATLESTCNVTAVNTVNTTQNVNGQWKITSPSFFVLSQLFGRHQSVSRHNAGCATGAANNTPLLQREDFSDWHMVQVRKPDSGETPTKFYDLDALRGGTEMRLLTDRRGFFSTPGFMGTWPNNEDNSSRVTMNQILIVALGKSFEGEAVSDFSPTSLDAEHIDPTSECYGCHQTLDPMRDFVRASYTNFYGQQLDEERMNLEADFVFGGVTTKGKGVADLAQILANHPEFAYGWVQKLCYYANAEACPEGEELDRVAGAFVDSNFDFTLLVRELFSSPLITGSKCVSGVDAGTKAVIARRSLLCAELSNRLGIEDLCGLRTLNPGSTTLQNNVRSATESVPDDSFSRAVVEPVVIGETGMFTRANHEAACVLVAQQAFATAFPDLTAETAPLTLVTQVMALPPSDPRHAGALAIVEEHITEAMALGGTELEALQSAFVLACMSPGMAGVGF
jgi:hypothetical protein